MKRTQTSKKKLALKRAIVRQLGERELSRADGGTDCRYFIGPNECLNPVYSA